MFNVVQQFTKARSLCVETTCSWSWSIDWLWSFTPLQMLPVCQNKDPRSGTAQQLRHRTAQSAPTPITMKFLENLLPQDPACWSPTTRPGHLSQPVMQKWAVLIIWHTLCWRVWYDSLLVGIRFAWQAWNLGGRNCNCEQLELSQSQAEPVAPGESHGTSRSRHGMNADLSPFDVWSQPTPDYWFSQESSFLNQGPGGLAVYYVLCILHLIALDFINNNNP